MAGKFDMIAKIEEGANPIHLGIAAPAEGEEVDISNAFTAGEVEISASKSNIARLGEFTSGKCCRFAQL